MTESNSFPACTRRNVLLKKARAYGYTVPSDASLYSISLIHCTRFAPVLALSVTYLLSQFSNRAEIERANRILRYGIRVSKGECFKAAVRSRYAVLSNLLNSLVNEGWKWQARILKMWVLRFLQAHKNDLQARKPDKTALKEVVL